MTEHPEVGQPSDQDLPFALVADAPGLSLADQVHNAFAPQGILARAWDNYTPRQEQLTMACAVAQTLEEGGALVVEAGTGVGKTYAYLVPALLSGKRVLLSTATKTLQDQLFGRDLPRLAQVMGVPVRCALLKGRGSYLCLHRLAQARQHSGIQDTKGLASLAMLESWSHATRTGDLAELPDLDERSPVLPWVTSTRENCLGSTCPQARDCHVNIARREAMAADVVVVNHHLFFADIAVRESGVAELLPSVHAVVLDEAHQINETGIQFMGRQLSTGQLQDFAGDLLATGLQWARGFGDWQGLSAEVEEAARWLRAMVAGAGASSAPLRWLAAAPDGLDEAAWQAALARVEGACMAAQQALAGVAEMAPDLTRLQERAQTLADRVGLFRQPCPDSAVRWADASGLQLRMVESPLDIAELVATRLMPPTEGVAEPKRAWIFTSATLGSDAQLSWFVESCGLADARVLRVASPFNYAQQAAVYVPRSLPRPNDPAHSQALASWLAPAARQLGGRTLVLTTSLRALRSIGEVLEACFPDPQEMAVLVQGKASKRRLLERFRQGNTKGQGGCILVASMSFWEGVDLPGDALQLVVIDKLPFPPPHDPLVEARCRRLEQAGRSPFSAYSIPEAAIALKQGAGRLIRSETDRGILVIGDNRLVTMGYGKRLMGALPPMRRLVSDAEFDEALAALEALNAPTAFTRASTTVPHCP